jgi:hypothetical protein
MSVQIVISHEDKDKLPRSFKDGMSALPARESGIELYLGQGAQKHCEIETDISEMKSERRRRQWWNARSTYNLATFELRAKLGSGSDVSFELLYCKEHVFLQLIITFQMQ